MAAPDARCISGSERHHSPPEHHPYNQAFPDLRIRTCRSFPHPRPTAPSPPIPAPPWDQSDFAPREASVGGCAGTTALP